MNIVTRGLGDNQSIITRGYGAVVEAVLAEVKYYFKKVAPQRIFKRIIVQRIFKHGGID